MFKNEISLLKLLRNFAQKSYIIYIVLLILLLRSTYHSSCIISFWTFFILDLFIFRCGSAAPKQQFSFFQTQLIQRHYSAKKRQPIKHGLSFCSIIGKFSLPRVHGHFTKSLYNFPDVILVSIACCAIFVFYVTSSPCRPSANLNVVWYAISKSGTEKSHFLFLPQSF